MAPSIPTTLAAELAADRFSEATVPVRPAPMTPGPHAVTRGRGPAAPVQVFPGEPRGVASPVNRHNVSMGIKPRLTATYFDGWYADMVGSEVKDGIQQRTLGLPPHLLSTSLLSWEGIAEVVEALGLT